VHLEADLAPAADAVRTPVHEKHAVPMVDLNLPFSHAVHIP
jgi:hypothetical protein